MIMDKKAIKFILITVGVLIGAVLVSLLLGTDRIYTHFFYIPLAISATQFPRYTGLLGIVFVVIHFAIEIIFRGQIEVITILRGAIMICVAYSLNHIWYQEKEYLKHIEKLDYQRYRDGLTGAYNMNYFQDLTLEKLGYPLTVVYCDIDFLKKINDTYGHLIGDGYIIGLYNVLNRSIREQDTIIRYGGDEFLMILENCNQAKFNEVQKRIHQEVEKFNEENRGEELYPMDLEFSMGYSVVSQAKTFKDAIESADKNMYKDKALKRKA